LLTLDALVRTSTLPGIENIRLQLLRESTQRNLRRGLNECAKHPDVVPYAQRESLTNDQRAAVVEHLTGCAECRDLVLFIHKTNTTLLYEGRIFRVASALRMSREALECEAKIGTSIAAVLKRTRRC
jgi:hypothetical protein